jgi:hypothetical protein
MQGTCMRGSNGRCNVCEALGTLHTYTVLLAGLEDDLNRVFAGASKFV